MTARSDARERGGRLFCELGGTTVALEPQDLDPVGLFVPMARPPSLDRSFELRLRSPIGELIAKAQVVHVIPPELARRENKRAGCALVFVDLADDQRAWIGLTLASLAAAAPSKPPPRAAPTRMPEAAAKPLERAIATKVPTPQARPAPQKPVRPSAAELRKRHWVEQRPRIRAQLRRELDAIEGKAPWEVLGIARDADPEAARQAFLVMSKRYHPHAYARFDCPEINALATALFIATKRALTRMASLRPPPASTPVTGSATVRATESKRPRGVVS